MPRDLFRAISDPSACRPTRAPLAWPVSLVVHLLVLVGVVVIPLAATDVLPQPRLVMATFEQPLAPPLPPPPPAAPPVRRATPPPAVINPLAAPVVAPPSIGQEDGLERVPVSTIAELAAAASVVPGGIEGGALLAPLLPPPAPKPVEPLPIGGKIKQPQKVRHVPPVYPRFALEARVQGVVFLQAVIDETGDVQDLQVLKGVPLLDQAAIDAVRQWKFTPTLLNGVPVPVFFTVTVHFRLQ